MDTLSCTTSNSVDIGHPVVDVIGSGVVVGKLLCPMRIFQSKRHLLRWRDPPTRTQSIPEEGIGITALATFELTVLWGVGTERTGHQGN